VAERRWDRAPLLAPTRPPGGPRPSLLLVGHGSRSPAGVAAYWDFAQVLRAEAPELDVGCGFIELAQPDLDTAIDRLVAGGATSVVAVPLVLLGAGHLKNDGPSALDRGRARHPGVAFSYGRHLGIHPAVLEVARDRVDETIEGGSGVGSDWAVVVVGRGSSDPDANADLFKVARLLWDLQRLVPGSPASRPPNGRHKQNGQGGSPQGVSMVEPAFVSLTRPSVSEALERCLRLEASRIAVVPYFLFTGVLVERIRAQAQAWAARHQHVVVRPGPELGPDRRLARLVLERYREALADEARMNCDCCIYRIRLGRPAEHHHATDRAGHVH
jgi:sirohydrochlorin ferrochelatase